MISHRCWHKPVSVIACQLGHITSFHINTHPQYDNHVEVLQEKLRLLKTEFEGIKDDLDRRGDKYVFNVGLKFFEQTAFYVCLGRGKILQKNLFSFLKTRKL